MHGNGNCDKADRQSGGAIDQPCRDGRTTTLAATGIAERRNNRIHARRRFAVVCRGAVRLSPERVQNQAH
jgi:hypothetical protein